MHAFLALIFYLALGFATLVTAKGGGTRPATTPVHETDPITDKSPAYDVETWKHHGYALA
jgi:hypothetical protein